MYLPRRFRKGETLTADDLNALIAEIVRLGKVRVSGGLTMHDGPGGLALSVAIPEGVVFPAVATSTITVRSGNTVGSGTIKLRILTGETLSDGETGLTCKSNFSTAVASGKAIMVARSGSVIWLVSADCP